MISQKFKTTNTKGLRLALLVCTVLVVLFALFIGYIYLKENAKLTPIRDIPENVFLIGSKGAVFKNTDGSEVELRLSIVHYLDKSCSINGNVFHPNDGGRIAGFRMPLSACDPENVDQDALLVFMRANLPENLHFVVDIFAQAPKSLVNPQQSVLLRYFLGLL